MAIFPSTAIPSAASDFTIPYSCRFDSTRSTHLERTMGTPTNAKKWVYSGWHKQGKVNHEEQSLFNGGLDGSGSGEGDIQLNGSEQLYVYQYSGGYQYRYISTAKYRDPSAWYNVIVAVDTTQGTASNRVLVYVNGTLITDWDTETDPSQDLDSTAINTACEHRIGNERSDSREFDGYIAETHFIDGMSFFSDTSGTANSSFNINTFGETGDYGEWKPIKVAGVTYGDNGFYHDFADAADLGDDESGEGNDFSETNIVANDQMLDTPTNNFATWNPLLTIRMANTTLSEGNAKWTTDTANRLGKTSIKIPVTGKWYAECVLTETGGGSPIFGAANIYVSDLGGGDPSIGYRINGDIDHNDGSYTSDTGNTTWAVDDIMAIAIDADAGTIKFYKNNVLVSTKTNYNTIFSGHDAFFAVQSNGGDGNTSFIINHGQDSSFAGEKTAQGNQDSNGIGDFYYTPPTDYLALCTSNLPAVAVVPSEHFNTVLYTGTGGTHPSTTQAVTGVGFQPDFVWIKIRSQAYQHFMYDAVRGVQKNIHSDATDAEATTAQMTAFGSDGFTVANVATGTATNKSGDTFVAWNWKAGSTVSGTTSGSGDDTDYTGSVNTDAGFSIIRYGGNDTDGHLVPHHLGVIPDAIFIKNLTVNSWNCFFPNALGADAGLQLDNAGAEGGPWYSTHLSDDMPTSSVTKLGSGAFTNASNSLTPPQPYIMYSWVSKEGYSKIGKYTGNGDADGTFVYTGFRPAWMMVKHTTQSESWTIWDTDRDIHNKADLRFFADATTGETQNALAVDILSNGFKFRHADASFNDSGDTFIYLAFAETPFKYSNAR